MSEQARVRIGNQTAVSAPYMMRPFEYALSCGFDAFEWFPDKKESGAGWEENDVSGETRAYIREAAAAADIALSVHASLPSNPLQAGDRQRIDRAIAFAGDIGATLINVHMYQGEAIDTFAGAIVALSEQLALAETAISIENTIDTPPDDFNELFRTIRRMDVACPVGMCLDLGHANLCPATRNDYLKYIDLLDAEVPVIHIHLHENYGDRDNHLPLFTGPAGHDAAGITGFILRMKRRGFSGRIILEQWPQPEGLLRDIRDRLLAMFSSTQG